MENVKKSDTEVSNDIGEVKRLVDEVPNDNGDVFQVMIDTLKGMNAVLDSKILLNSGNIVFCKPLNLLSGLLRIKFN